MFSKVETINDSYMVASGLPEKNGDLHAAEIANLAIALQSITPTIVVRATFVTLRSRHTLHWNRGHQKSIVILPHF